MRTKDKELLLKDLCARLPYGVIVQYKGHNAIVKNKLLTGSDLDCNMEYYKPYLRPMSSMTEEEEDLLREFNCYYTNGKLFFSCGHTQEDVYNAIDLLNKKGFDYRGLIEKGLAIKAPEDIYG